jgi:type IV secretory pathway VirB10-like protein
VARRKLKVFQAQFGFYDSVVAASSQAAALRAWGTHQNLFASGEATPATDAAAVAAALEHPDTPLRRAVGSSDPFQLEPSGLPKVPDAPERARAKAAHKPKPAAAPKPPADRTALDAAEAALRTLDEARKREEADLRRRQDELDAAKAAAQSAYVVGRKAATAAIVEARTAYRRTGGEA